MSFMSAISGFNPSQSEPRIGVSKRPFPYPYQTALALCSDIDQCDRSRFVEMHRFLGSPEKGLGLPVADSMFAVGANNRQLSYFNRDGKTPSADAPFLRQAIRSGLIDSLHTWGDFNDEPPEPGYLSCIAENLAREFRTHQLTLPVWINHGSPNNRQNFRARLRTQYNGDNQLSPYYTMEFARLLGIKYYWWSEVVKWPLSPQKHSLQTIRRQATNAVKNMGKRCMRKALMAKPAFLLSELAGTATLRDGSRLIGFTRYNCHPKGVWGRPTRHTMRFSLSQNALAELLQSQGYAIVYTHMGLPAGSSALFERPDIEALERLAEHYHRGRIWVETTSRLLNYWLLDRRLAWKASYDKSRIVIELLCIHDPATGDRQPAIEELSGICFYTPNPESTVLRIRGTDLPLLSYPADATGRRSAGLAISPLPTELLE
jgi:hypothetical protein